MHDLNLAVLIAAVLAVWRVTNLVVIEDGPWHIFTAIRRAAVAIKLERLVACFLCASVWIAIPCAVVLAHDWRSLAILIPALSGGAIVIDRLTTRDAPAAVYEEEA